MAPTTWYGDESYYFADGKGCYFIGLARPLGDPDRARSALTAHVASPGGYLHFYEAWPERRHRLAVAVREAGFEMAVVAWIGQGRAAQARSACLKAAARRLHGVATDLVLESVNPKSDAKDARGLARMYPTAHRLEVSFVDKRSEPLVWVPDIVAGAAHQAFRHGRGDYLEQLRRVDIVDAP